MLKQTELKQEKKEPCDTSERGQSPRENFCVCVRAKCNQTPIETLWQPLIHNPSLNMEMYALSSLLYVVEAFRHSGKCFSVTVFVGPNMCSYSRLNWDAMNSVY